MGGALAGGQISSSAVVTAFDSCSLYRAQPMVILLVARDMEVKTMKRVIIAKSFYYLARK